MESIHTKNNLSCKAEINTMNFKYQFTG